MIENWRKQSTGGVGIPRKNTSNHWYQKASQETIYTGIIIQNEQVIFMNMCVCVCTHRHSKIQSLRITVKKSSWIMAQRRWLKWEVFKGGMGMEKGCNYMIISINMRYFSLKILKESVFKKQSNSPKEWISYTKKQFWLNTLKIPINLSFGTYICLFKGKNSLAS